MALIPIKDFVESNEYKFSMSTIRTIAKRNGGEKILKRISSRIILVDTEALEDWLSNQKFYQTHRAKKPKIS